MSGQPEQTNIPGLLILSTINMPELPSRGTIAYKSSLIETFILKSVRDIGMVRYIKVDGRIFSIFGRRETWSIRGPDLNKHIAKQFRSNERRDLLYRRDFSSRSRLESAASVFEVDTGFHTDNGADYLILWSTCCGTEFAEIKNPENRLVAPNSTVIFVDNNSVKHRPPIDVCDNRWFARICLEFVKDANPSQIKDYYEINLNR